MKKLIALFLISSNLNAASGLDSNVVYSTNPVKGLIVLSNNLFKIRQLPDAGDASDSFKDSVLFEKNLGLKDLFIKNTDKALKINFFEIKIKEPQFEDVIRVTGQLVDGSESHLSLKRILTKELESNSNDVKLINKGIKELSTNTLNKAIVAVDSLGCNSRGVCLPNNKKINIMGYNDIIKFVLQNRSINDIKITVKIDNFSYSELSNNLSLLENGNVILGLDPAILKSVLSGFSKKIIIDGSSLIVEWSSLASSGNLFF